MNSNRKNASDRICRGTAAAAAGHNIFFDVQEDDYLIDTENSPPQGVFRYLDSLGGVRGKLSCHYLKILNYKLGEINTIFFKNGCCFSKIINKEQWRYPGISITKGLKNSSEDDVASFHVELPSHFLNAISE